MGDRSFGKGSVQTILPMNLGDKTVGVKLTTARSSRPRAARFRPAASNPTSTSTTRPSGTIRPSRCVRRTSRTTSRTIRRTRSPTTRSPYDDADENRVARLPLLLRRRQGLAAPAGDPSLEGRNRRNIETSRSADEGREEAHRGRKKARDEKAKLEAEKKKAEKDAKSNDKSTEKSADKTEKKTEGSDPEALIPQHPKAFRNGSAQKEGGAVSSFHFINPPARKPHTMTLGASSKNDSPDKRLPNLVPRDATASPARISSSWGRGPGLPRAHVPRRLGRVPHHRGGPRHGLHLQPSRQLIHGDDALGMNKALNASRTLPRLNPALDVRAIPFVLEGERLLRPCVRPTSCSTARTTSRPATR